MSGRNREEDTRLKITRLDGLAPEGVSHNPRIIKRVMLRQGDVPRVTQFAQSRLSPGDVAPAHAHRDMLEVFFVESGEGKVTVDGVPHRVDAGSCIAIEPGESHEIESTGDSDLVLTYFGVAV